MSDLELKNPYPDWDSPGSLDEASNQGSAFDWIKGFGWSALESMPELFGKTPSTDTLNWRQDNPVSGFVSGLVGTAVPYMGWFKAAKLIKPLASIAEGLKVGRGAFAGGALSTAAQLAPFEAGRVAANEVVGDQSLAGMTGAAVTDLALGSGIGGLFSGLATAGTRNPKLASIFPGLDITAPLPLQARAMRKMIESGEITDPEMLGRARGVLNDTLRDARVETLPGNQRYVGDIDHSAKSGSDPDLLERQLNRLFKVRDNPDNSTLATRRFAQGSDRDFTSTKTWQFEADLAGLPPGFEEHGQYFRQISFNKVLGTGTFDAAEKAAQKQAATVNNTITKNMEMVDKNTFITREADDGMFIIARKYEGDIKKGFPDDKWVLFKTDKPGYFLPGASKWATAQTGLAGWQPNVTVAPDAGPVYNEMTGYMKNYPLSDYNAIGKRGVIEKMIPESVSDAQITENVKNAFNEYLVPRIHQFKKSSRANYIQNVAKSGYDQADVLTNQMMNGIQAVDPGKNLFFSAMRKGEKTGIDGLMPANQLINSLSEGDFKQFIEKVWRPGVPAAQLPTMMARGDISPETMRFAQALDQISDHNWTMTNLVEEAVGRKSTEPPIGSYGVSRRWEGDTRIELTLDNGEVQGYGAGANRKLAQANAQKLLKQNPDWRIGNEIRLSLNPEEMVDFMRAKGISPAIVNPVLAEKQGLRGFMWDLDTPTKADFSKELEMNIGRRNKYQANLGTTDLLQGHLNALSKEDPAIFSQVAQRLNDMAGTQSDFGKWQNAVADKILAPMIGGNSATKIVGATNQTLFHLMLGGMKLSFPVTNITQFVQTVLPEQAFVMGKVPDVRLAPKYSFFAAGGTKGPVGGIAVLNPIKMMGSALADMRNPSPELTEAFGRAVNDRTLEPRFVEDFIGQNATKLKDVRSILTGDQSFVSWLKAMSEWLPAESERLSRTHAFTVGFRTAQDFFKNKDGSPISLDQAYQYAKEFTNNTMYLYSAADRPRAFTTPAGSLMGLFHNWMFHYLASMGEYAKEGFTKNNWAPLLWQTGGTMAIGGLAATPVWAAANEMSKLISNKSLMQLAYDNYGEKADGIMYGLPPMLTGMSLSSGVNTPLSNPVRDGASLFSVAAWGKAQALSKAAGAAFDHWQTTGEHPAYDRNVRDLLIKTFAPTTIYRALGAMDPGQITSLGTGLPLVKDVPLSHRLLYSFGFNPIELQRAQDASQELYENHEQLKAEEKKLGQAWANAEMNSDGRQMSLIMRQGMTWGVDISKVIKEGMYEIERQRNDLLMRTLRPQDIQKYRAILDLQEAKDEGEGEK